MCAQCTVRTDNSSNHVSYEQLEVKDFLEYNFKKEKGLPVKGNEELQ
jgi:hypothetical protein